jgi:uncharacterized membrane protein
MDSKDEDAILAKLMIQQDQLRHQLQNLAISADTRERKVQRMHIVFIVIAVAGLVMLIRQSFLEACLPSAPEISLFFVQRVARW